MCKEIHHQYQIIKENQFIDYSLSPIRRNKMEYSSMAFRSNPFLITCGKNNQPPVTATNPTVSGPETILCNLHPPARAFFAATSTTTQKPCKTKNHVTSHVGLARDK